MRVTIPHKLSKEEVRKRLDAHAGELADFIPGSAVEVENDWIDDDHMALGITAMGAFVGADLTIEERQVIADIELPMKLMFVKGTIERKIRDNGVKLLA